MSKEYQNHWTPEQTKANRELWVEALLSGKYEQTKRHLRDADGYCCLGVGCDIFEKLFPEVLGHDQRGSDITPIYHDLRTYDYDPDFHLPTDFVMQDGGVLPTVVKEFLGLAGNSGEFFNDTESGISLAGENDDGRTFPEIVALIRREPKGLIEN